MATTVDELKTCPRCATAHHCGDFRGSLCGWCADDLERQQNLKKEKDMIRSSGEGPVRETLPTKPTTIWKIAWQHELLGGRVMQPGELELEVTYNTKTDPTADLPDRFQLMSRHVGRGGGMAIVMARESAVDLYLALGEALEWNADDRAAS
jgi:hypothetical protein